MSRCRSFLPVPMMSPLTWLQIRLRRSELVPAFKETLTDPEERLGADIVMKSLRAPCRLIADNAGVEGEVIVQRLLGKPFEVRQGTGVC